MSLFKIKNELYKKETDVKLLQHEQSEFDPKIVADNSFEKTEMPEDVWAEKKGKLAKENKKTIKIGLMIIGGIILAVALVVGFYKIRQSFFAEERLTVSVEGPTEIKSGNLVTYEIKYKNNNRADLKNAVLKISFPEDFKPEENANFKIEGTMAGTFNLGGIKGYSEGRMVFNGRAYSPKGNLIKIKAELSYTPSTVNSVFVAGNQLTVNIVSAPITLEVMAPQNISSQDEINYLITYKNEGTESFENIRIKVDYPEQFNFSSSNPRSSEGNNIWYVGNLSGGQSEKIIIAGKMKGDRDEIKTAKVTIGANNNGAFVSYNEETVQTKIVSSPLAISQTVNGLDSFNASAGDTLQFEINYKNEGDIALRDVIVTERLDSPVLDYTTLNMKGGAHDMDNKTIIWKSSDYKELKNLAPGQNGMIKFSIKVKNVIPVENSNDKNFVISSLAKIDSPDVPTPISMNKIISGNSIDIKLNSKLVLDVKGYYGDANISNSGPLPPKVSEETTYTMHFILSNISNDIEGAKVETVLPTSVVMTGKIFPEGAPLDYNERMNSIVWNVGNLAAGTGVLFSAKEIAFQVKIKPSPDQIGKEAPLINESIFSARDTFTGESFSVKMGGKTTNLLEDSSVGMNYKVAN